jgi:ribonuclease HI
METTPIIPKQVTIVVGISGDANRVGPSAYCAVLKHLQYEKQLTGAYSNSLPLRVTLRGVIAGLQALKGSCEVTLVVQNEIVVRAFEEGWILDWEKRGLLGRKTTKVKHTDLYAQVLEAMDGHVVRYRQPSLFDEEQLMERAKGIAKPLKRSGPWEEDVNAFDVGGLL